MARKKRSERQGEPKGVAVIEKLKAPVSPKVGPASLQALCPLCGRAIPERRVTVRSNLGALETKPYFDSIDWDPDKPFGIRLPTNGKGSFKDWSYIDKDEAPVLFEALKRRFLEALREWVDKGWITEDEVANLIAIHQP